MYQQFEAIFCPLCGCGCHRAFGAGPAARQTDPATFAEYRQAFQGYIGRKYGARFREFIGSRIEVTGSRQLKSFMR